MLRHLGVALTAGLLGGTGLAAEPPVASPEVASAIEKLGDPSFRDREAASKDLLARGSAVLDALERTAAAHADPEVRQRAADLVEQLRHAAENARLIPTKTVRLDFADVPLAKAIADLKTKTGIPVVLDVSHVAEPNRTVTVRTEEIPVWQAVEEFRKAAGLVEVYHDELPLNAQTPTIVRSGGRRISYSSPPAVTPLTPETVPVVFRDGTARALPGDRTSGVRVVALPPAFRGNRVVRGSGQVIVNLEVSPMPGLKWSENATIRVQKAEDETGRPVTVSHRVEAPDNPAGVYQQQLMFGGQAGNVVLWDGSLDAMNAAVTSQLNPRVVPVVLKTEDRSIRTLRVFEGVVSGEITLTNQPLITLSKLPKAVGVVAGGPQGVKLTVLDYKAEPSGRTVLKIRTENPNPWTQMRMGRRQLLMMNAVNVNWAGEVSGGPAVQFHYTDDKGTTLRPQTRSSSSTDDGVRQVSEVELVFPMRPDIGAPTQLVVTGQKVVPVEIPFKLKDVPLP